ncbi:MAG: homoserine dehydrogenase [Cyclobacteriaceae bacterium]
MREKSRIGLFGFGVVGQGLYDILEKNRHFNAEFTKICVKDKKKSRTLPANKFTFDKSDILENEIIDLVVELINDADDAFEIVKEALTNGKKVITANKKMVAEHFEELFRLQQNYGGVLLYEAACCGSIPIIRNLEEYFDNEPLRSVYGIFNGSSNYILSKVFNENMSYSNALAQAQALGFAEKDPTLDVGGFDAANKLCIIAVHAFGLVAHPNEIFTDGIQYLNNADIDFAKKNNVKIKLLAHTSLANHPQVINYVMPTAIDKNSELINVEDEFNGVIVEGQFSGEQLFKGKGAGGHPTGSAVLSDISASFYQYQYEYKKYYQKYGYRLTHDHEIEVYFRCESKSFFEKLKFNSVQQKNEGDGFFQVIGTVNLRNLLDAKGVLSRENHFIMSVESVPFVKL